MIKKLQRRFIRISVISLSVAMVLVVIIINLVNWFSVQKELRTTLDFISESGFSEREFVQPGESLPEGFSLRRFDSHMPKNANRHERNMVAQSNWFCVSFDENADVLRMGGENMIEGEDESSLLTLAGEALTDGDSEGRIGDYLFKRVRENSCTTVYLLNCETRLTAMRKLMLISFLACLGAILLTFAIVSVASRRAVAPTIKNMEQQKQFITNASHELKTPLTVISTNMELLDMEIPGNSWVSATKKQTSVMRHLVDELVYLSRMEEENAPLIFEEVSMKSLIGEVAEPFEAMAEYSGRDFHVNVDDALSIKCDRASVTRLISTLLDNAMKYASGEGSVDVSARADGRYAQIEVSNSVDALLSKQQCEQLFDRFYRADPSRSKDKQSGFGIGLAIARAIAEKHGGTIEAQMVGTDRLKFVCRLPIKGIAGKGQRE